MSRPDIKTIMERFHKWRQTILSSSSKFHLFQLSILALSFFFTYYGLQLWGNEFSPKEIEVQAIDSISTEKPIADLSLDSILNAIAQSTEEATDFSNDKYLNSIATLKDGMSKIKAFEKLLTEYKKHKALPGVLDRLEKFEKSIIGLQDGTQRFRIRYEELLSVQYQSKDIYFSISSECFAKDVIRMYHKDFKKNPSFREEKFKELEDDLKLFGFKMVAIYEYHRGNKSIRAELKNLVFS